MKTATKALVALAATLSVAGGGAQAALVDRGGGMIYDDVLNITWLQDANYVKSSRYKEFDNGRLNWFEANTWAANLVFGGYDDWRLPRVTSVRPYEWRYEYSTDGTTDVGYNITSPHSELSYMYYVNLGLKGYYSPTGVYQADFGIFGNGRSDGPNDVGLVKNLVPFVYWFSTENARDTTSATAWVFSPADGDQVTYATKSSYYYAWAVRDGDVLAVPEPASALLIALGLAGLGAVRRRRLGA